MVKATDRVPWSEVDRLLREYGSTDSVPGRIEALREERGWKAAELVRKVNKVRPATMTDAKMSLLLNNKRGISLEEATAFAAAFDVSIVDLLLPEGAMSEATAWGALQDAADALNDMRSAWATYCAAIYRVRSAVARRPALLARIKAWGVQVTDRLLKSERRFYGSHKGENGAQSWPVWVSMQMSPTPAIRAVEDVLGAEAPTVEFISFSNGRVGKIRPTKAEQLDWSKREVD